VIEEAPLALAVVDPDPKLRTRLALQLGEDADVVTYSEVAALAEYQPAGRPMIVVFGPGRGRRHPGRRRAVDEPSPAGAAVRHP
jgi:hypothetical protein